MNEDVPAPDHLDEGYPTAPDPEVAETTDALAAILGDSPRCPMCGTSDWAVFPHDVGLAFTNPDTQDQIATSFHSVVFTCIGCRFIRVHGVELRSHV